MPVDESRAKADRNLCCQCLGMPPPRRNAAPARAPHLCLSSYVRRRGETKACCAQAPLCQICAHLWRIVVSFKASWITPNLSLIVCALATKAVLFADAFVICTTPWKSLISQLKSTDSMYATLHSISVSSSPSSALSRSRARTCADNAAVRSRTAASMSTCICSRSTLDTYPDISPSLAGQTDVSELSGRLYSDHTVDLK